MMKASEYFNIPVSELSVMGKSGYYKGDCVILDHTLDNYPFYNDLNAAKKTVEYYKSKGWYNTVLIIETDYADDYKYAILTY